MLIDYENFVVFRSTAIGEVRELLENNLDIKHVNFLEEFHLDELETKPRLKTILGALDISTSALNFVEYTINELRLINILKDVLELKSHGILLIEFPERGVHAKIQNILLTLLKQIQPPKTQIFVLSEIEIHGNEHSIKY